MELHQITSLWNALDPRRRVVVILASLAMFAAVIGLTRMASSPSMTLLYAGLENSAAGEVVAALEQRGVIYEVRGGAIMVESSRRDALRMTLASEGLPANASRGYELLDNLSGFGTTSQMFNAAYWRAKEGELARTIVSHPGITSARVHIANTSSNPFSRDLSGSASVAVTTGVGGITPKHARALKFLVASAVTGLSPEDVSVIDGNGELIGTTEEAPSNTTDDRAEVLRQKVTRLLEARVGPGNAVVEVAVETVTRSELLREKVIDPGSRVAISTDTEERSNSASGSGGDVTVASNLPDGAAGGDNSSSQNSETRERVNYEVSQTEREITLIPGAIKRLTVAVLVNGSLSGTASGDAGVTPRSESEMSDLHELVSSAVGYDEARGDTITIKTLAFEAATPKGSIAEASFLSSLNFDAMSLVQTVILGVVALILGLFVVRPILSRDSVVPVAQLGPPPPGSGPTNLVSEAEAQKALTGEIETGETDVSRMALVSDGTGANLPEIASPGSPIAATPGAEPSGDPVDRLRNLIDERRDESVEILRMWLEGEEEKAS